MTNLDRHTFNSDVTNKPRDNLNKRQRLTLNINEETLSSEKVIKETPLLSNLQRYITDGLEHFIGSSYLT